MSEILNRLWTKPRVLLAALFLQVIVYWLIAIYRAGELVPVAYQKF